MQLTDRYGRMSAILSKKITFKTCKPDSHFAVFGVIFEYFLFTAVVMYSSRSTMRITNATPYVSISPKRSVGNYLSSSQSNVTFSGG
jgi:hypothetical protein